MEDYLYLHGFVKSPRKKSTWFYTGVQVYVRVGYKGGTQWEVEWGCYDYLFETYVKVWSYTMEEGRALEAVESVLNHYT